MESYRQTNDPFQRQWTGPLAGVVALATAIWLCLAPAVAAPAPEAIATPVPLGQGAGDDATLSRTRSVERIIDFVRFLLLLCDEQPVPTPLLPRDTVLSISAHLTPEGIDLLERRLKDPEALALIRRFAPELSELLPILAAGAPLVRDMHPEIQVIVARQDFDNFGAARPRPVLPAVAIVFSPKDVPQAKGRLLSTFWAVIAGANEIAKKEGRSRLRLESGKRGDAFFACAHHVDPPPDDASREELIRYNFTPAIGIVGQRFVISTGQELGRDLVDLARGRPPATELVRGPRVDFGWDAATGVVLDNLAVLAAERGGSSEDRDLLAADLVGHLRVALDRLPDRTRRLPNLLDRWRTRRLARRDGLW